MSAYSGPYLEVRICIESLRFNQDIDTDMPPSRNNAWQVAKVRDLLKFN